MKLNLFQLSAVVFVMGATTAVYAQGDLAGISGKITDVNGFDLHNVTIVVKNESTGFTASTKTNEKGEYNLKQLPLGSPYTVTIISEEHGEEILEGYSLNQGDLIWVPFKFTNGTTELNEVMVSGQTLKSSIKQVGASTSVSAKDLQTLPVNGRNFTSLIDLSPLSNGTSIGGQLSSSVDYTIDGMSNRGTIAGGSTSSSYSISMEAIREFKVVTNEYDVTNGRAGGGTISTVTKSGTNKMQGSAFLYGRTDWLSSPYDIRGNKRDNEFSTYQYGFSLGGPIKKDKAHFFVAWDRQVDKRPLFIANINNESDEALFNVTQSTLDQFLSIAREKYGVSNNPQFGSFNKNKDTNAAFLRLDWQINARNLLTLRNNFVHEKDLLSEGDNTRINMYESYIDRKKTDNSLMLSLRTDINDDITNELKV
ncbi:TonB-dependent receptor [Empedobacter falsenii]|uniref:TonB-dependent receptor n=2 Tax=Empedobacter TaxID=59734 RepID=UPI0021AA0E6A|nr:carboxypeptidase-like regulatory domain-containing protein [Empedobacter falsenii]